MFKKYTSSSLIILWAVALCGFSSFGLALLIQHVGGLEPCPLCIVQRVIILCASVLALLAALVGRQKKISLTFSAIGAVVCIVGALVAGRHMQVMWSPQEVSCGPDLAYMMESFPPSKWMPKVFAGEAECAAAAKELILGLPIPVWSVLMFVLQFFGFLRAMVLLWRNIKLNSSLPTIG